MPLLRITHQRGAFTEAQKAALAEELTHVMLIAEGGADTPEGRSVAYVVFHETDPKTEWYVAGKPDLSPPKGGRFIFDVVFPIGAASQSVKTELHRQINDIVARVLGVDGTFPNRASDWVLINEITDGNWGASGVTIGIPEIAGVIKALPERADFYEPLLAATRRVHDAHGFPAGSGRH